MFSAPPPCLDSSHPPRTLLLVSGAAADAAESLQSRPTLCDPVDGRPPGSSVPGILQARILEWVAISFSNACMHAKSLQLCSTLCNPMDSSPTDFPVHGVLQARVLEWVAISFSRSRERPAQIPREAAFIHLPSPFARKDQKTPSRSPGALPSQFQGQLPLSRSRFLTSPVGPWT